MWSLQPRSQVVKGVQTIATAAQVLSWAALCVK